MKNSPELMPAYDYPESSARMPSELEQLALDIEQLAWELFPNESTNVCFEPHSVEGQRFAIKSDHFCMAVPAQPPSSEELASLTKKCMFLNRCLEILCETYEVDHPYRLQSSLGKGLVIVSDRFETPAPKNLNDGRIEILNYNTDPTDVLLALPKKEVEPSTPALMLPVRHPTQKEGAQNVTLRHLVTQRVQTLLDRFGFPKS